MNNHFTAKFNLHGKNLLNNYLLIGTLCLTITGILSRVIGFFYRIFLSRTIGATGIGIYQLIFPIYALCITFSSAGIQTAISRYCAESMSNNNTFKSKGYLYSGISISLIFSFILTGIMYNYAGFIANSILGEAKCEPLLKIMAFALPCEAIHSCISGYYYGHKKTAVPAISQLIEQVVRVYSVYLILNILIQKGYSATPSIAAFGILTGEIAGALFCITAVMFIKTASAKKAALHKNIEKLNAYKNFYFRNILAVSIPITLSRLLVNILQSVETIMIPSMLKLYGFTGEQALTMYGVLTGMALPLILFPSAITSSASIMLLPEIANANAAHHQKSITHTTENTIKVCTVMGIFFTGIFVFFGPDMGIIIFDNEFAGKFIKSLGFICPFLYLTTTLTSILHGLGKTVITLVINVITLTIRILFLYVLVPVIGINGYMWGILLSMILKTLLMLIIVKKNMNIKLCQSNWIIKPAISVFLGIFCSAIIPIANYNGNMINVYILFTLKIIVTGIVFLSSLYLMNNKELYRRVK